MKSAIALAALVVVASPSFAAEARFPKGAWSVGAGGGVAFLRMGDVNEQIRTLNGSTGSLFEELNHGGEWMGAVRYALDDRFFVGLEAGGISAHSKDPVSGRELGARGTPALAQVGIQIDASDDVALRALGGLGALVNASFEERDAGPTGASLGRVSGTAPLAYAGAEVEVRMSGGLGITAQAILRAALLQHPSNAPYDVDFSGGAARGGVQWTFGGSR